MTCSLDGGRGAAKGADMADPNQGPKESQRPRDVNQGDAMVESANAASRLNTDTHGPPRGSSPNDLLPLLASETT